MSYQRLYKQVSLENRKTAAEQQQERIHCSTAKGKLPLVVICLKSSVSPLCYKFLYITSLSVMLKQKNITELVM